MTLHKMPNVQPALAANEAIADFLRYKRGKAKRLEKPVRKKGVWKSELGD